MINIDIEKSAYADAKSKTVQEYWGLDLLGQAYYLTLYHIYDLYMSGLISMEKAKSLKCVAAKDYEQHERKWKFWTEIFSKTLENITLSEKLRCEIAKGLKENEPLADVLSKAVSCIGLMASDSAFGKMGMAAIAAIEEASGRGKTDLGGRGNETMQ